MQDPLPQRPVQPTFQVLARNLRLLGMRGARRKNHSEYLTVITLKGQSSACSTCAHLRRSVLLHEPRAKSQIGIWLCTVSCLDVLVIRKDTQRSFVHRGLHPFKSNGQIMFAAKHLTASPLLS